jgi:hypothetical protein|nr:MAG: hypothetical protein KatS3mg041_0037 [Bacteroidota bacterium]
MEAVLQYIVLAALGFWALGYVLRYFFRSVRSSGAESCVAACRGCTAAADLARLDWEAIARAEDQARG